MTTDWSSPGVAQAYEDYDPMRERALAYPVMFDALRLGTADGRVVLDYGCGTGKVAERIVRTYGARVIGAEPSPGMLSMARAKRSLPEITYRAIADDQRLDLPDASVDGALSCFIFVCISEADRIQRIAREVHRVLKPGAAYAMLEINPDTTGIPFATAQMGDPGRTYRAGEPIEVRLARPDREPMILIDYFWPEESQRHFLSTAGFRTITVHRPTLPDDYQGPDLAQMQVERTHPPYAIYVARK
ncbi:class I SAM-dependent methyltransferase [Pendulispora albinea]|uniref:Class I SAM-dependent methyltransferase n=1 Tax=Pendulispora albinea TaxID=2741071 RepID=A0ABZ2M4A4_9BACT